MLQKFHYLKNVEGRALKYTNASFYNIPEVHQYLGPEQSPEMEEVLSELILNSILSHAKGIYKSKLETSKVKVTDNINSIAEVLTSYGDMSAEEREKTSAAQEVFALWYANNMINGYFLNEIASGNPEYYDKGAVDVVKRQSGV